MPRKTTRNRAKAVAGRTHRNHLYGVKNSLTGRPTKGVGLHRSPDSKPEMGNTGIGFIVDDVAKEEKALRRKGVRITVPTKTESWGTYFLFADPDGNEFWVFGD